jgi:hypothetical protein
MFCILKYFQKFLDTKKEIRELKSQIDFLKFELRHSLSVTEKYIPLMRTKDKIQLLILRRNLWTRS